MQFRRNTALQNYDDGRSAIGGHGGHQDSADNNYIRAESGGVSEYSQWRNAQLPDPNQMRADNFSLDDELLNN